MTPVLDWNAFAQVGAERIVDCLTAGGFIAVFARLVLVVARRQSAGARFAVWFSALMAIAALPIALTVMGGRPGSVATIRPALLLPASWALYLFTAWAAITIAALLRVGVGLIHLAALRKSCVRVREDSLDPGLRDMLARSARSRPVELCLSDQVQVPTAIGFFRPAVVLPRWLMNELSSSELNQVLLHELAHLRRWDDWTNLAQQIVKALLFFHPAVWWIEKKVSLEREMACDDAVLAETASPRAYAECLARLAEKSFLRRSLALAQAAVGRMRQTSLRVAQILDANRPASHRPGWKPAIVLVTGFAVLSAVGVSRAPQLVAFEAGSGVHAGNASSMIASNASAAAALVHTASWKPTIPTRPVRALQTNALKTNALKTNTRAKSKSSGLNTTSAQGAENALATAPRPSLPDSEPLVHPAGLHVAQATSVPALFVVVEGYEFNSSGQSVYQISVWRITVRQPADHLAEHPAEHPAATAVPRKT